MRALTWRPPALLLAACLTLAALTLLAPSSPSYDPFAWIVWGRELIGSGETFGVAGGPSWKPLPVLFTTPFSLAGDAAPALWLLVARTGALLALAGAFRLADRLAGRWAGAIAAVAVLLLDDFVSLAWRGASEPLLLACILWAAERHLAGRRQVAFALGVAAALIRPEVVPFLVLYAAMQWRGAGMHERLVLLAGLALAPLLWIGVPAIAGDPFAASTTAMNPATRTSALSALRGDLGLTLAAVWLLALAAVVLRPGDRALRVLALGAAAWLALLTTMAAAGYAGVARYALSAAAIACVLAGVALGSLVRRWPRASALLLAVCAAFAVQPVLRLDDQVRAGVRVARAQAHLRAAVDRAGGLDAVRSCALGAWLAVGHLQQSALAWELHVPLDRVARTMDRRGLRLHVPRDPVLRAHEPSGCAGVGGVRPRAQNHI